MAKSHEVRTPQQKRSIEKKEKIIKAAYKLFCEKSYYKTSTPEIAAEAQVSIGCLYSYFKDKHTIFMEIYDRYLDNFNKIRDEFCKKIDDCKASEEWLRTFIEMLIKAHQEMRPFVKEIQLLKENDPEIIEKSKEQNDSVIKETFRALKNAPCDIHIKDIEAGAIVVSDFVNVLVDRIALTDNDIDTQRILDEGITAIMKYIYD